jgi:hypothetical protein
MSSKADILLSVHWFFISIIIIIIIIIPWSRMILQKLTDPQIPTEFSAFTEPEVSTQSHEVRHSSLFWFKLIWLSLSDTATLRFILLPSFHLFLVLPSGLVLSGLPTNIL